MKLRANYTPLGELEAGTEQALWGNICTLENVGSEDLPELVYVVEIDDKDEAKGLVDTGRFEEMTTKKAEG